MKRIVIFASGSGSNAENIICSLAGNKFLSFPMIISNRRDVFVHERAERIGVPSFFFSKQQFEDGDVLKFLLGHGIDFIVLAGFLLRVPVNLLQTFHDRIINIHPALLPKFGGQGMYGDRVHEAVVAAGERESGITIHYVNENYDEGRIIFQARCIVNPDDTPGAVAARVHELEYRYFPKVIEQLAILS
ncbi:MAG: phosphoribosylglycinamide formyltransferase [Dysgonamonadaceae bacterium]|jgi:phosphoribosylglycinamide formyltransferase-1|nr:phosphoribosylglycinamide formyltransferase [Dysgonamonadaceae bacterium]